MPIIRNLSRDLNEGRMDNLRTLTYEETGTQSPFVTKDILNPPNERGVLLEGTKRIDDLTRISKLITNTPGQKFLFNEGLLKQGDLTEKLRGNNKKVVGNIIRRAGGTAKHLAQVVGSTLAQVPVNGTGTHFVRAFRSDTYFQDTSSTTSGFVEFFGGGGVEGSSFSLTGAPVPFKGVNTESELADRNTTVVPGTLGINHIGIKGKLTSPVDISFNTANNPFYQNTEDSVLGATTSGIIPIGTELDDEDNSVRKFQVQTTAQPFTIGIGKSRVGAISNIGEGLKVNPILVDNIFNPNNDKEYIQSKTELNIINASTGKPIKNPRGEVTGSTETGVQTTLIPGSIGITNQFVTGSISTGDPVFETFSLEKANEIKKSTLETSDNINNTRNSELITLKESPSKNLMKGVNLGEKSNNAPFELGKFSGTPSTYTGFKTEDNINNILLGTGGNPKDGIIPIRVNGILDSIQVTSVPIPINDENSGDYNGLNSSIDSSLKKGYIEDFRAQRQNASVPKALTNFTGRTINTYSLNYKDPLVNKETRVGLGNQGKTTRSRINYTSNDPDTVDKLNALDVSVNEALDGITENRDLIQLEFQILTPEKTFYLGFRAFLDTFDDSFNASWNDHKYLGRADSFYTYGGFDRTITIGFKIAAASREEMKPLYRKAATLASVTAPTYGRNGRFMRGSLAKVTVGDYIYEQPGIIESVQYTWQTDYPWEISFQNPEGQGRDQILPHVLEVSINFKVIHDFLPTTGINPFITNYRPIKDNKDIYIPLENQEFVTTTPDNSPTVAQNGDSNTETSLPFVDNDGDGISDFIDIDGGTGTGRALTGVRTPPPTIAIDNTYVNTPKFNSNKLIKNNIQNFKFNNNIKINNSSAVSIDPELGILNFNN